MGAKVVILRTIQSYFYTDMGLSYMWKTIRLIVCHDLEIIGTNQSDGTYVFPCIRIPSKLLFLTKKRETGKQVKDTV
jgi:hypothetical protein